jgi:hypothetical protein
MVDRRAYPTEKALLVTRENAIRLKQAYTERVKMRADSQREVNDLLQRKATWTGPDVIRFTELVQTEHENDRAEKEAKEAMDAAEAEVEKGFSGACSSVITSGPRAVRRLSDGTFGRHAGHPREVPRGTGLERQGEQALPKSPGGPFAPFKGSGSC